MAYEDDALPSEVETDSPLLRKADKAYQAAYHRAYRAKRNTHPDWIEKHRAYLRKSRAKDPNYLEKAREYARKFGPSQREALAPLRKLAVVNVLTNGEGTCRWCGQGDIDVLTIDHINNDGAEHRKTRRAMTGNAMYSWLIKNDYPEGFQVLCFNCNVKKELLYRRSLKEGAKCQTTTK
jgi:hypothetical protein